MSLSAHTEVPPEPPEPEPLRLPVFLRTPGAARLHACVTEIAGIVEGRSFIEAAEEVTRRTRLKHGTFEKVGRALLEIGEGGAATKK